MKLPLPTCGALNLSRTPNLQTFWKVEVGPSIEEARRRVESKSEDALRIPLLFRVNTPEEAEFIFNSMSVYFNREVYEGENVFSPGLFRGNIISCGDMLGYYSGELRDLTPTSPPSEKYLFIVNFLGFEDDPAQAIVLLSSLLKYIGE